MSRITLVQPETATGASKDLLTAVKGKMGMVPNLTKALANSPAALKSYLDFAGAVSTGILPGKTRELIALTVGQANSCDYCLSAHSVLGKMAGLTPDQIIAGRHGTSTDAKTGAILHLSKQIVVNRGVVTDGELQTAKNAGVTEAEITEVVANVALNIFTNYFNHVAGTEIDFPKAAPLTV